MSRCRCGNELERDHRYCPQCGSPADGINDFSDDGIRSAGRTVSEVGGNPETILLHSSDDTNRVEMATDVQASLPRRWIAVGLMAVGLLLWGLFSWPQPQTDQATGSEDAAADTSDSSTQDATSSSDEEKDATTTTKPRRATTTTRQASPTADAADAIAGQAFGGDGQDPVLVVGEPTGLGVVVGSFDGRDVDLLELDTGRRHQLDGMDGIPLGLVGLTLLTWEGSRMTTLDISEPGRTPSRLLSGVSWVEFLELDDDRVWVITYDGPDARETLTAYSAQGDVLEERELGGDTSWWQREPSSDLVVGRVGGVYRRTDGGDGPDSATFRKLSDGRIVAQGRNLILIDECDEQLDCGLRWVDSRTWRDVDHPTPEGDLGQSIHHVVGHDRYLITTQWETEKVIVTRLATGEVVREIVGSGGPSSVSPAPISEDGRWLVDLSTPDSQVIVDLDSGMEWPIEALGARNHQAVFIDLSETMFASPVWDGPAICHPDPGRTSGVAAEGPVVDLTRC